MRIVILSQDFLPAIGGVQTFLYETLNPLATSHEVVVVTPISGKLPPSSNLKKVVLHSYNVLALWRVVRHLCPDRILIGHAHPRLLLAAWLYSCPSYAAVVYGNDFLAAQRRWHRPLFNRLLARSRPLVTISQANAYRLQQLISTKPAIIYPGTDPGRFSPPEQPPPPPLRLITVGRLVPRKGIDTVLEAMPSLMETVPTLHYDIVGDGPDRSRLETMAGELGVASAITLHGLVPDEELPDLYRKSHIFVMPAREEQEAASVEGFGIVYLEASASGLPVVAGHSGGAVEAVRHGETGFLVPPDDADALSKTLTRLLADAELRRRLGQNGRRWVETEMNWDRAARELADLLDV